MINWRRYFFIITVTIFLHIIVVSSVTDHLVPPPPPPKSAIVSVPKQHLQPSLVKQPSARGGPPRPPPGYPQNRYANNLQQQPSNNEPPGFMQRIARWFGFNDDNNANEQQIQASQQYVQYKDSPRGGINHQNGQKANCGLCSNYPWVPMFPGHIQYPLSKHYELPQANQIHQVQWTQQQEFLHQQHLHRQQQEQQYHNQQQQQQQQKQQFQNKQQQQQQQQHQQQLNRQQLEQQKLAGYNYPQHQKQLPAYPPLNTVETQYAPTHFQPPLVQRAIQFSAPPSQDFLPPPPSPQLIQKGNPPPAYNPQPNFAPIPLPNLSPSALPPVYDAQPFRPIEQQQKLDPTQFQQLPKYQPSVEFQSQPQNNQYEEQQPPRYDNPPQFQQVQNNENPSIAEHIAAPSEFQTSYPTQIPPNSFITQNQAQQTQTTPSFEIVKSHQVTNFVSEIEYPANFVESQSIDVAPQPSTTTLQPEEDRRPPITLTELGSYSPQYTVSPEESQSLPPEEQYSESDSIFYHNHQEIDSNINNNYAPDNYPSASSHNLSVQNDNLLDIDPIQHSSSENYLPQNEIFLPTPEPTTLQPQFVTDFQQTTTTVEIVPSLQTTFSHRLNFKRDRETPKRLLDSPIHYFQHGGSSPRPFTRDPASLDIRSTTTEQPLYQNHREEPSPTPTPWHMVPTPTSTYTSIDASGHYAGMTPPSQQGSTKKYHQIIIPYTTKHKPRPFTPKEQAGRYDNWSTSSEFDPHEQQESKVVTATHPPGQRTTKYLTKILASNLRELLKKEHEIKNRSKNGFDLSKLQNTIDDWTEQEFTSLSHRASTVSLGRHSKHIPTEYLTTTPSLREAKTTIFAPNHHEPLLYKDRGTRRYEFNPFEDNRIEEPESTSMTPVPSTSTTTTTTTPSTPISTTTTTTTSTTEASSVSPYYIRVIPTTPSATENWNKAKVTVSPSTNEKIYVVTPQPASVGSFKSPRFIVRPTPASAGSNVSPKPTLYTPELFGLMGISAYIPAAPVETFDGHSKVITVVTPSNISKGSDTNEVESSDNDLESKSSNSDHKSRSSSSRNSSS